ncbi:MAG: hypothetical protein KDK12_02665 [Rhodobacteraceae bacterium]|nr:hypothetical protein [Paracoccaceae bacterium]
MRVPVLPLAISVLLLPAMAAAGGMPWVSDTAICPDLRAGTALPDILAETDVLLLQGGTITGMEYHCVFDPALDLDAPDGTITTHIGYCEEPGFITPSLFTFRMERFDTPRTTLFDGGDTPTVYFACP